MEREPIQRESIQGGQEIVFKGVEDWGGVEAGADEGMWAYQGLENTKVIYPRWWQG